MRVFVAHNFYQQPGGEDEVFRAETALLERNGHDVYRYTVHNDAVADMGQLELARATLWNRTSYRELRDLFRTWRPDIVHVHNTLPLISPAIYYAAQRHGAGVVQTLHNYRLFCPPSTFYRDGKVCEDCLNRPPWPAVRHACYRGSRAASAVVATMLSYHRARGTYSRHIDLYLALTEFAKAKFVEGGFDATKIRVKPNFVAADPGLGAGEDAYALYVGRLTEEKGIRTLLQAWAGLSLPLQIVGDGPLADEVGAAAARQTNLSWAGRQPRARVLDLMKGAAFLVFPSTWYETFGNVIIEAYATGLPVVASRLGSAASLVVPESTGLHFEPGDAEDLKAKVAWLGEHPELLRSMRQKARQTYETTYTAETNYEQLMDSYASVLRRRETQAG